MSNHTPTPEQQKIIDTAKTGASLVVEALAGTGKTSTLEYVGRALSDKRCLYAAFTKSTQLDAQKRFPKNVECRTMHSLAWAAIVKRGGYSKRFGPQKMRYEDIARLLGIDGISFDKEHGIRRNVMVGCVRKTVERFCKSADEQIEWYHVDLPEFPEKFESRKAEVRKYILAKAQAWWTNSIDKAGVLQFFQNESLKLYQLSHPTLPYDVIFYDEAQDANPVIDAIISEQTCQRILVGDRNQQIFAWNGAIDAMDGFKGDRLALTQSFRFGPAIADYANIFLSALESPLQVKGFDKIDASVTAIGDLGTGRRSTPDAVLCRTNGGCIAQAIELHEDGIKVAFAGGPEGNLVKDVKSFAFAAIKLMKGEATDHTALCIYANWAEVTQDVENGDADDIAMLVKLINGYGAGTLIDICNNSVSEETAQVVVSTAHKAKGREWDRVRIGLDFTPKAAEDGKPGEPSKESLMLIYVAVTRAKEILDAVGLSWFEAARIDAEVAA